MRCSQIRHEELGEIRGKLLGNFPSGSNVKLLLQPEDLIHDDQSKLKLEVVDRKFRGTNFVYTLKTERESKFQSLFTLIIFINMKNLKNLA